MTGATLERPHTHAPTGALRLGCVRYLNTLPLIEGLQKTAGVELLHDAPAALIDLLLSRRVDAALLSIIDAQRSPEPVTLIPAGVIASDSDSLTVRLFSAVEPSRVRAVHADTDSHTAAALSVVLLRRVYGASPALVPFDAGAPRAGSDWPEAVLLIGDKAVTGAPPREAFPHQIDLGRAWRDWTGLPFVYAAWACLAEQESSAPVRLARDLLERQRRHNATRIGWIAHRRAPERNWPAPLAAEYLCALLRFDAGAPDSPSRRAVERFFDLAHEEGLTPARQPTRWLDAAPAAPPCPR